VKKTLLVRVDASQIIGTGHIMRCIAFGQGWRDNGGHVCFLTYCESDSLCNLLEEEEYQVVLLPKAYPDDEWTTTSQIFAANPDAWVVLDGYHFDTTYQDRVKEICHRLLVIDDLSHLSHYSGDVILNQNVYAHKLKYNCNAETRLLMGSGYALLRSEFLYWSNWRRNFPEMARRVLVSFGGSDSTNQTLKVIQAMKNVNADSLEVVVVIGANNPHYLVVNSEACSEQHSIQIKQNVTDMPKLMAWADIAITAGGSTCWELAFMQLPSLIVTTAENQRYVAPELQKRGVSSSLGWWDQVRSEELTEAVESLINNRNLREVMGQRGRELVDGRGVARVCEVMDGML